MEENQKGMAQMKILMNNVLTILWGVAVISQISKNKIWHNEIAMAIYLSAIGLAIFSSRSK
jgi:hypothetical protein